MGLCRRPTTTDVRRNTAIDDYSNRRLNGVVKPLGARGGGVCDNWHYSAVVEPMEARVGGAGVTPGC